MTCKTHKLAKCLPDINYVDIIQTLSNELMDVSIHKFIFSCFMFRALLDNFIRYHEMGTQENSTRKRRSGLHVPVAQMVWAWLKAKADLIPSHIFALGYFRAFVLGETHLC